MQKKTIADAAEKETTRKHNLNDRAERYLFFCSHRVTISNSRSVLIYFDWHGNLSNYNRMNAFIRLSETKTEKNLTELRKNLSKLIIAIRQRREQTMQKMTKNFDFAFIARPVLCQSMNNLRYFDYVSTHTHTHKHWHQCAPVMAWIIIFPSNKCAEQNRIL